MMNKEFNSIFNDDPLGLLEVRKLGKKQTKTTEDMRLIRSFEEINEFYEEQGRTPDLSRNDVEEFMLASRLKGMQSNPEKVKKLLPFDFYDLLKCEMNKSVTVEDIIGDDPFSLLLADGKEGSNIFNLKHVKKSDRIRPDYVSRRIVCKDFDEYEPLFQSIHDELKRGARRLKEFKEEDLVVGKFYVLRGVLLYLEKSLHVDKIEDYDSGIRIRKDGRTRCIFDNGTESDMLYRSLYKALLKDGYSVGETENVIHESEQVYSEDIQNGYIYVLKSMSTNPQISKLKDLYKVGYCSGDVTNRIKNASNEPTYLMAEVTVVLTVRCYNLNVKYLESHIHDFFKEVNVDFEVYDKRGKKHNPREWFIAPIDVIEDAINLIVKRDIHAYMYDVELGNIIKS